MIAIIQKAIDGAKKAGVIGTSSPAVIAAAAAAKPSDIHSLIALGQAIKAAAPTPVSVTPPPPVFKPSDPSTYVNAGAWAESQAAKIDTSGFSVSKPSTIATLVPVAVEPPPAVLVPEPVVRIPPPIIDIRPPTPPVLIPISVRAPSTTPPSSGSTIGYNNAGQTPNISGGIGAGWNFGSSTRTTTGSGSGGGMYVPGSAASSATGDDANGVTVNKNAALWLGAGLAVFFMMRKKKQ